MTEYFVHDTYAQRIAFGRGAIRRLSKETAKLGVHRLLLLSTPGQAAAAKAVTVPLHNAVVGHYSGAVGHVPIEVVEDAIEEARHVDADGFLSFGGGSTIGLGKILSRDLGLPQVTIPNCRGISRPMCLRPVASMRSPTRLRRFTRRTPIRSPT